MPIPVAKHKCNECGKPTLQIIDAGDDRMTVQCTSCGDENEVEVDAFGDGGVVYWPQAYAAVLGGEDV